MDLILHRKLHGKKPLSRAISKRFNIFNKANLSGLQLFSHEILKSNQSLFSINAVLQILLSI